VKAGPAGTGTFRNDCETDLRNRSWNYHAWNSFAQSGGRRDGIPERARGPGRSTAERRIPDKTGGKTRSKMALPRGRRWDVPGMLKCW